MIEDRQPRRGFRDNASEYEQFDEGGPERAWPTAGHRPPGYGEQGAPDGYAFEQSGADDDPLPRRAAHADGDRDDADDLQYGPPTDRYAALADLAYDPNERDRGQVDPVPSGGPEPEGLEHPNGGQPEQPQELDHPYAGRPEQPRDFDHPYAGRPERPQDFDHPYRERFEPPQVEVPHAGPVDEAYRESFEEPPQGVREPLEQRTYGEPGGPDADGTDTDAPYRRGSGQDEQPTAVYGNPYDDQHVEQGGLPWGPPMPAPMMEAEAGAPTDIIDLTAPRVLPRTHRGEQRKRVLVLACVAAGVLVAGGAGFAIFGTGSSDPAVPAGAAPAEEDSTTDPQFPDESGAATEAAPPPVVSTSPSASATVRPSAPATTTRHPSNPRPTTANPTSTGTIKLPPVTRPPTIKPPTKPTTPPTTAPTTAPPTAPSNPESTAP